MIVRRVLVSGRVQGVGFRAATERQARRLMGMKGYVRNLPDGRVEVVFAGDDEQVFSAVQWCRKGPSGSHVTTIEVIEEPSILEESLPSIFEIRY